jgi:osmotically-inducible protein OsmY
VKGVRAIAQKLKSASQRQEDFRHQIAKRLDIIAWDSTIPKDKVQVKVQGIVTLSGEVDYYQRTDAEYAVRKLEGIKASQ